MRLRSDFHDYYDRAIGYGIDSKVVYERKTRHLKIAMRSDIDIPTNGNCELIGFCGQVHPLYRIKKYERVAADNRCWSYAVVDQYFAYTFEDYQTQRKEWEKNIMFDTAREQTVKRFFHEWSFDTDRLFHEYATPIWAFNFRPWNDETNFVVDPPLKEYEFERVKDANSAFQEISVYLANILIEQKEVIELSDSYRVQKSGFDLKTSFRRAKNDS